MRVIPAPAVGSGDSEQIAVLMATINQISAENNRLKSEAGKVQVKQVFVDRKVDNPVLLERIEQQRKQIEALEKARLQSANVTRLPTVKVEHVEVEKIVERVVSKTPHWVFVALILTAVVAFSVGHYAGKY